MSETVHVNYGPGLMSLLTVLFVGLKLTGYIDWEWIWVLAPLWGGVVGCVWLWEKFSK